MTIMSNQNEQFTYSDERFADLQMLRYRLKGFEDLSLPQQLYIYCLSKATLMGRDITFDQQGKYNLAIRKTLEAIYKHYEGDRESADFQALLVYLKRVWFSSGIYHHYGCEKFVPGFSEEFFTAAIDGISEQIVAERDRGTAVLLVSLELDEVMDLSDRILVMYEGEIVGEFDPKKVTVEELGLYMAGAKRMEVAK